MSDENLVKRLREPKRWEYWNGYALTFESNAPFDAADAIERLTRERDEAQADHVRRHHDAIKQQVRAEAAERKVEVLREALTKLLARDERNTCQHDETHRGGVLWEICDCGAQWADDEGGKPEWKDPSEWTAARAALAETEKGDD